jgi:hypothetical protein
MKRRRRASYVAMLQALSDRHLAVTGVALTPRLVVTDFEVRSHRKKTFETEFFFLQRQVD